MALPNPQTNQPVMPIDNAQNVQVNLNTTAIGTPSLVGSILYRLGIIKDYVIESGSNSNGNYEKWASGKLVQTGQIIIPSLTFSSVQVSNIYPADTYPYKTFPIPFVGSLPLLTTSISNTNGFGSFSVDDISTSRFRIKPFAMHPVTQSNVKYDFISTGRWKD